MLRLIHSFFFFLSTLLKRNWPVVVCCQQPKNIYTIGRILLDRFSRFENLLSWRDSRMPVYILGIGIRVSSLYEKTNWPVIISTRCQTFFGWTIILTLIPLFTLLISCKTWPITLAREIIVFWQVIWEKHWEKSSYKNVLKNDLVTVDGVDQLHARSEIIEFRKLDAAALNFPHWARIWNFAKNSHATVIFNHYCLDQIYDWIALAQIAEDRC